MADRSMLGRIVRGGLLASIVLAAPAWAQRVTSSKDLPAAGPTGRLGSLACVQPSSAPALRCPASGLSGAMIATDVMAALGYVPIQLDGAGNVPVGRIPLGLVAGMVAAGNDIRIRSARTIREWGAACDGVADDSLPVSAAALALKGTGAIIGIPGDCRLLMGPAARLAGKPPVLDGVQLVGPGTRDGGEGGTYGTRGGTILLADTGGPAFIVKRHWTVRGLTFFWPAQVEDASAPRAVPALLAGLGAMAGGPNEVTQGRFLDNDVVNAWRVADFSKDVSGGLQVRGNRIFAIDAGFVLNWMPVESFVSDNMFSPNAFGVSGRLRDYAAQNAAAVLVVGDGTPSARATHSVDALMWSNNAVFGIGYGWRVQGGFLNTSSITGSYFDGVTRVLSVGTGGGLAGQTITGGNWFTGTYGTPGTTTPAIEVTADSVAGAELTVTGVNAGFMAGPIVEWLGAAGTLRLAGMQAPYIQGGAAPRNVAVRFNSASGTLSVDGCNLIAYGTATGPAISVEAPTILRITGNRFARWMAPISVAGYALATITGNISQQTTGAAAYVGGGAGSLPSVGNVWDQPVPGWDTTVRGTDGAMVLSFGGLARMSLTPGGALKTMGPVTPSTTP